MKKNIQGRDWKASQPLSILMHPSGAKQERNSLHMATEVAARAHWFRT